MKTRKAVVVGAEKALKGRGRNKFNTCEYKGNKIQYAKTASYYYRIMRHVPKEARKLRTLT